MEGGGPSHSPSSNPGTGLLPVEANLHQVVALATMPMLGTLRSPWGRHSIWRFRLNLGRKHPIVIGEAISTVGEMVITSQGQESSTVFSSWKSWLPSWEASSSRPPGVSSEPGNLSHTLRTSGELNRDVPLSAGLCAAPPSEAGSSPSGVEAEACRCNWAALEDGLVPEDPRGPGSDILVLGWSSSESTGALDSSHMLLPPLPPPGSP